VYYNIEDSTWNGLSYLFSSRSSSVSHYLPANYRPFLSPSGTRLMGGKDAASPRYVFTKLEVSLTGTFNRKSDMLRYIYQTCKMLSYQYFACWWRTPLYLIWHQLIYCWRLYHLMSSHVKCDLTWRLEQAITRCIFHPHDDPLLNYLDDDGNFSLPLLPDVASILGMLFVTNVLKRLNLRIDGIWCIHALFARMSWLAGFLHSFHYSKVS
jgi:hypothetical protein